MEHHSDERNKDSESRDQVAPKSVPESWVSRRGFLKSASAGAVGTAVGSRALLFSPSPAYAQGPWQYEADIVVVGTGAAGSFAALNAQRLGNRVLLLEKAASYGGTTAKSGGDYWIPNNPPMQAQGIQDSRLDALRYMIRVAYPHLYNPEDPHLGIPPDQYDVLGAFYDNGALAVEALHSMTRIRSKMLLNAEGKPWVNYRTDVPEDKGIRGRSLGSKSIVGAGKGAELIAEMRQAVVERGIPVLLQHRASRLLLNRKDEVVGLEVKIADGKTAAVRARKAVIFGSGGFTHNRELRLNFLRGPVFGGCAVPTSEGDFVYIAAVAGASLVNMTNAWWAQIVLEQALDSSSTPFDAFGVGGDSVILVNRYGRRIVNEKINYNDRTQVHFVYDPGRDEYPNLLTFMVYDQRTAGRAAGSFPIPPAASSASYVISGQTIEELVRAIEARVEKFAAQTGNFRLDRGFGKQLEQTIVRFNEFAKRGVDEDFHRGEMMYELMNYSPVADKDKRNPTMYPFSASGPYYAIILVAGTLDTKGGPKINARAQIVATSGKPIPGLYGAGNCIGFPAGQAYWGLGSTLGPALTFGYIAAREASKEALKEVDS